MYIACYTAALNTVSALLEWLTALLEYGDRFLETSETSLELPQGPPQDSLLSYVLMSYFDHVTELEHIIMFILHKMIIFIYLFIFILFYLLRLYSTSAEGPSAEDL